MLYDYSANLEKDGWELGVPAKIYKERFAHNGPSSKQLQQLKKGDVVGIILVVESEKNERGQIVTVTHHRVWVQIEEVTEEVYKGLLKTTPEHPVVLHEKRFFLRGEEISFKAEHIVAIR